MTITKIALGAVVLAKECGMVQLASIVTVLVLSLLRNMRMISMNKELTFEEFCALPMELGLHISAEKEHYMHRYNRETNVNKVVITPVKKNGCFGNPVAFYYFPNDPRTFHAADQVYLAYMEQVCGVTA
jgi:hypothetical protein